MKKVIGLLLACSVTAGLNAQKIMGRVKDAVTKAAIENATIFFSGTSAGVFSDKYGNFSIDISKFRRMPLSISALGYFSSSVQKPDSANFYTVLLTPKTYELNEVKVEARGKNYKATWKRNIEDFKKQFLGESINALNCEIVNESDLYFGKKDEKLIAYAFKPVIIENKRLGYKVTYFLDRFEYVPEPYSLLIRGEVIFEDMLSSLKPAAASRTLKRRETTYLGSRMHFFRSLWENKLDSAGYEIKNKENQKLTYETLVVEDKEPKVNTCNKFLHYPDALMIAYYSKFYDSFLKLNTDYVYFERSGYIEPLEAVWNGKMALQRIGDLLPFDYRLNEKK